MTKVISTISLEVTEQMLRDCHVKNPGKFWDTHGDGVARALQLALVLEIEHFYDTWGVEQ